MAEQESLYLWSTTALTNETSDPAIGWAENQLPSTVNNSARAMMAAVARFVKDTDGSLTTAGSANAYTLTINGRQTPLATGHRLSFKASFANTAAATLAVTNADAVALGTKAIRAQGDVALATGSIVSSGRYDVEYDSAANSAAGAWMLLNGDQPGTREVLTAAKNYYVRTDGSDSNTGLANTAGAAFLTIQKAVDTAYTLDSKGFTVTINVADGTYTTAVSVSGPLVGNGTLALIGNTSTPANVLINVTGSALTFSNYVVATMSGFKFQATVDGVGVGTGASLVISNYTAGPCTGGMQFQVSQFGRLTSAGAFTIVGNSAAFCHNTKAGSVNFDASTCTLSGTPVYSTFFFGCSENSWSIFLTTWSGSATGPRAFIHQGAIVETNSGNGDPNAYFPGNSAGSFLGDGSYNDHVSIIPSVLNASANVGTPASGYGVFYIDSTSKSLMNKDDAGTIHTTVVPQAAVSRKFVSEITTAGVATLADKSNTALALRVNRSASQTPSAGVWTKIQLNVEASDPNTWFDNATNYRLQPTVACVLMLVGSTNVNVGLASYGGVAIYKNGTEYNKYLIPTNTASDMQVSVPALVSFNGSSDYVELFGFSSGASPTFAGGAEITKLDAYQLY